MASCQTQNKSLRQLYACLPLCPLQIFLIVSEASPLSLPSLTGNRIPKLFSSGLHKNLKRFLILASEWSFSKPSLSMGHNVCKILQKVGILLVRFSVRWVWFVRFREISTMSETFGKKYREERKPKKRNSLQTTDGCKNNYLQNLVIIFSKKAFS